MKKLLIALLALALLTPLCAVAEEATEPTGEWYSLGLTASDEISEERPGSLDDLPEEYREIPEGGEVTFTEVSDAMTIIVKTAPAIEDTKRYALIKKGSIWSLYEFYSNREIYTFDDGEGSVFNWFLQDVSSRFTYTQADGEMTITALRNTTPGTVEWYGDDLFVFEYYVKDVP